MLSLARIGLGRSVSFRAAQLLPPSTSVRGFQGRSGRGRRPQNRNQRDDKTWYENQTTPTKTYEFGPKENRTKITQAGGQEWIDWESSQRDIQDTGIAQSDRFDHDFEAVNKVQSGQSRGAPFLWFDSEQEEPLDDREQGIQRRRDREMRENGEEIELPSNLDDLDYEALQNTLRKADRDFFQSDIPPELDPMHPDQPTDLEARKRQLTGIKLLLKQQRDDAMQKREDAKFFKRLDPECMYVIKESVHTRVVSSGNEHSYKVLVVGGNGRGYAGFGIGKATTMDKAMKKAQNNIRRNMLYIPRLDNETLYHPVVGKHNQTKVKVWRRPRSMTEPNKASKLFSVIFEAFGIVDVTAKVFGQRNVYSQIYALFDALSKQVSIREVALARGKKYTTMFDPTTYPRDLATEHDVDQRNANILKIMEEMEGDKFKSYLSGEESPPNVDIDFGYEPSEVKEGFLPKILADFSLFSKPLPKPLRAPPRSLHQKHTKKKWHWLHRKKNHAVAR